MGQCPITKAYCVLNPSGELDSSCLSCKDFQHLGNLFLEVVGIDLPTLEKLLELHCKVNVSTGAPVRY